MENSYEKQNPRPTALKMISNFNCPPSYHSPYSPDMYLIKSIAILSIYSPHWQATCVRADISRSRAAH